MKKLNVLLIGVFNQQETNFIKEHLMKGYPESVGCEFTNIVGNSFEVIIQMVGCKPNQLKFDCLVVNISPTITLKLDIVLYSKIVAQITKQKIEVAFELDRGLELPETYVLEGEKIVYLDELAYDVVHQ